MFCRSLVASEISRLVVCEAGAGREWGQEKAQQRKVFGELEGSALTEDTDNQDMGEQDITFAMNSVNRACAHVRWQVVVVNGVEGRKSSFGPGGEETPASEVEKKNWNGRALQLLGLSWLSLSKLAGI